MVMEVKSTGTSITVDKTTYLECYCDNEQGKHL